MEFPIVKQVNAKLISDELDSVKLIENHHADVFNITHSSEPMVYERNYIVDESNIESTKADFRTDNIQIGDQVVPFDDGGWEVLAGRAGLDVIRDGKIIISRITRMN